MPKQLVKRNGEDFLDGRRIVIDCLSQVNCGWGQNSSHFAVGFMQDWTHFRSFRVSSISHLLSSCQLHQEHLINVGCGILRCAQLGLGQFGSNIMAFFQVRNRSVFTLFKSIIGYSSVLAYIRIPWLCTIHRCHAIVPVSYTHLTLPTKRIV